MRTNIRAANLSFANGRTHEGAPAARITPEQALRRSVMSCFLWEDGFYENGVSIAERIQKLADEVPVDVLVEMAVEARLGANLRHVPLLLMVCAAKRGGRIVGDRLPEVIARADELSEFVALYWKLNPSKRASPKNAPLSAQVKRGLATAFGKFSEYALSKYNRDGEVKLRDVLFLCHAKPRDAEQADLWKRLIAGELKTPDTWEVGLSAGGDKKAVFERLIREDKLGYLALLRNLRNMADANVDPALVEGAIRARRGGAERVLPFRFVAAARAAPGYERALDESLCATIAAGPRLPGQTVVLVDVSGSMENRLSGKSDMTRLDAAVALASVINAERIRVFCFNHALWEVPARRGMAGVDAIRYRKGGDTLLFEAVASLNAQIAYDRLIVITDEQATGSGQNTWPLWSRSATPGGPTRLQDPKGRGYMVNVASNQNGVGYGAWTHLDGFSENVIRFIAELENAR